MATGLGRSCLNTGQGRVRGPAGGRTVLRKGQAPRGEKEHRRSDVALAEAPAAGDRKGREEGAAKQEIQSEHGTDAHYQGGPSGGGDVWH